MVSREILNSHNVPTLRQEISKTNIKGYSKMTKAQLVDVMMKNKDRFSHIKMKEKKTLGPNLGIFKLKPEFQKEFEKKKKTTKKKEAPKPKKEAPKPKKKKEAPKPKKKTKAQIINEIVEAVEDHLEDQIQEAKEFNASLEFGNLNDVLPSKFFPWETKYMKEELKKIKDNIKELIKEKGEKIEDVSDFDNFVLPKRKWSQLLIKK